MTGGGCATIECNDEGDCPEVRARCERGDANACDALGRVYTATYAPGSPFQHPELAEPYLVRACDLAVLACDGVVDLAEIRTCQEDYAAAARLLQLACDRKHPVACVRLARLMVEGVDVPRDTEQAARLFAWACDHEGGFPEVVGGDPELHGNAMHMQVAACVGSEVLAKLGLAGSVPVAETTPEVAEALARGRRRKLAAVFGVEVPDPLPAELAATWREDDEKEFAKPPEQLAAQVRASRKISSGIQICGPMANAPAI